MVIKTDRDYIYRMYIVVVMGRRSLTKKTEKVTISTKIPIKIEKKILQLIKEGEYKNPADFVWTSIRAELERQRMKKTHELIKLP
jgi:hypothetical protein